MEGRIRCEKPSQISSNLKSQRKKEHSDSGLIITPIKFLISNTNNRPVEGKLEV